MKKEVKRKKLSRSTIILIIINAIIIMGIILFSQPIEPSQPVISKDSVLLLSYSGIPFAFWFFISLGLMFGLTFHGFKLFSINVRKGECDRKHFKNNKHQRRKK